MSGKLPLNCAAGPLDRSVPGSGTVARRVLRHALRAWAGYGGVNGRDAPTAQGRPPPING
ncbi:MAG: hypothetical protein ACRDYX_22260 [Egibacteraceae bacterium]